MEYQIVDIRQRQLRKFIINLKRFQPEEWEKQEDLPVVLYYDLFVRSADDAGWFETLDPELDDLKYQDLVKVAIAVAEVYAEVIAPDPN